jgi:hypothetical protein
MKGKWLEVITLFCALGLPVILFLLINSTIVLTEVAKSVLMIALVVIFTFGSPIAYTIYQIKKNYKSDSLCFGK